MNALLDRWGRPLLRGAITLLFLQIWGFAAASKWTGGQPAWFAEKFGPTILGRFPGVAASFWLVTLAETVTFLLVLASLLRGEFLRPGAPAWLTAGLLASLWVFVQLGFGLWLTQDFNGAFQQFVYFGVTLLALRAVGRDEDP